MNHTSEIPNTTNTSLDSVDSSFDTTTIDPCSDSSNVDPSLEISECSVHTPKYPDALSICDFNHDSIIIEPVTTIQIPHVGSHHFIYQRIPLKYEPVDRIIIKGCEMQSKFGIRKQKEYSKPYLIGILYPDSNLEQLAFVSCMNGIRDNIIDRATGLLDDIKSIFFIKEGEETHHISFNIAKDCVFYDNDNNIIPWENLTRTPMKFIPTFCIHDIIITPHIKKFRILLLEAHVLQYEIKDENITQEDSQSQDLVATDELSDQTEVQEEIVVTTDTTMGFYCTLF